MQKTEIVAGVELGFSAVVNEFGRVFGGHIPTKNRETVVRAAVLSWLSEQLTSAVQNKVHFTEAQPIEQANNCVRMGYGGLIHKLGGENHICMSSILRERG